MMAAHIDNKVEVDSDLRRSTEESAGNSHYNQDGCNKGMDVVEEYDNERHLKTEEIGAFERTLTVSQLPKFRKIMEKVFNQMQDSDEKIQELEFLISMDQLQSGMDMRNHILDKPKNQILTVHGNPSEQDCLHADNHAQASGSDDFKYYTVQQLERKIMELEEILKKLKLEKNSKKKQELSCIDFEAYEKELPNHLYRNINDFKSTSACPCFCVACLINKFLYDEGYNLCLDSTEFLKVLSAITNKNEDSLRKSFCNPESEEGIYAFHEYLIKYLLDRKLIYEKGHFKTGDLNRVLNETICALERSNEQKNTFMLGLGYEKKSIGHCINFFLTRNRMAVLDAQSGGHCTLEMFQDVNDLRVYSLSREFKQYIRMTLPKPKPEKPISFSDFFRVCKSWRNAMPML